MDTSPRIPASQLASSHFLWSVAGRVGTITLNRPERKNPLTFESYAALTGLFRSLVHVREVRAIVITGAGGNFCSGGDVHEIIGPLVEAKNAGRMDDLLRFTSMTGGLVKAMLACPQPIVAAIDGVCAGAGAILAMASDIRFGTPGSRVAFLFTKVGLSGADMGACALLPRIVGQGRAAELLYTGRFLAADEAERWGFYNRVMSADSLGAESAAFAGLLADGPAFAHGVTKACLHEEWAMSIDDAISHEAKAQAVCMATGDFERAYHAFVEKRTPEFRGD